MCSVLASQQLDIVTAENVNSLVPSTYDTKEGTVVTLICYSKGYTIKGPSKVTCFNGKWLPEVPVCVSDSQTTDITTASNSSTYMEDNSIILITLALVFAFVCVSLMVLVMFKLCSHKVRSLKTSPLYMSPTALKYPSYTGQYPHWINSKWWTNNSSWTYRSTDKLIRDIERSRKKNPNHSWRDFVSLSSQQQF
ncbi:hypothetical protein Bpfe_028768 [Biomphalaria pfeifferi]|uniref:Sushi domain-containing protein n=1 Tax=Biomphalaria pfeifferi TaxID=112525 RepID=A0AAD8EWM1_BIOPF|nr:hypothetical protein Bpfe_028768 [Biomphalaria pfeifferi]